MAHLSHAQLAAVITAGGSVLVGDRVITQVGDLPTDEQLTADDVLVEVAQGLRPSGHGLLAARPAPGVAGEGALWTATDAAQNNALSQVQSGAWVRLHAGPLYDLLANRPAAADAGDMALFVATDVSGGTLYQVQGGQWVTLGTRVYAEQVWVLNPLLGVILRFAPNGLFLGTVISVDLQNTPSGICPVDTGSGQEAWVTLADTNTVLRLTQEGAVAGPPITDASLNVPHGIRQVSPTEVWVANTGNNTLTRLLAATGASAGAPLASADLNVPEDILLVPATGGPVVWISNDGSGQIVRYAPTGTPGVTITPGTTVFAGMANVGASLVWAATEGQTLLQLHKDDGTSGGADIPLGPSYINARALAVLAGQTEAWVFCAGSVTNTSKFAVPLLRVSIPDGALVGAIDHPSLRGLNEIDRDLALAVIPTDPYAVAAV